MEYIILSDTLVKQCGLKFRKTRTLTTYDRLDHFPIRAMMDVSNRDLCRISYPELLMLMDDLESFKIIDK